jgi:Flp pilus assembly protein CpaB
MKTIYLVLLTMMLLVFASAGGYLVMQLIEQRNKQIAVLFAKHNYPEGTKITDAQSMFELRQIREADLPPGVILDFAQVRGRILTREISEGEPVIVSHLKDPNKVDMIWEVAAGKKRFAIEVKAKRDSIQVGRRVNVLSTPSGADVNYETKTLFRNVLVLRVQEASNMPNEGSKLELIPISVTLELSPEEGEILASAVQNEDIRLIPSPAEN